MNLIFYIMLLCRRRCARKRHYCIIYLTHKSSYNSRYSHTMYIVHSYTAWSIRTRFLQIPPHMTTSASSREREVKKRGGKLLGKLNRGHHGHAEMRIRLHGLGQLYYIMMMIQRTRFGVYSTPKFFFFFFFF